MALTNEQIVKLRRIYAETTNKLARTTAKEKLESEGLSLTEEGVDNFDLENTIKVLKKHLYEFRKVKKEIDKEAKNSGSIQSLKEKKRNLFDVITELTHPIKDRLEKINSTSVLPEKQRKQVLDSYYLKLIDLAETKKEKIIKFKELFYYSINDSTREQAKANLIELGAELPEKEITTDIFFNSFIFKNSSDYVIGGFLKKKLDSITARGDDSALNMLKLKNIFEARLDNLIANQTEGLTDEEIKEFEYSTLENYFGFEPSEIRFAGDFKDLIMNHSGYSNWLQEIEESFIAYKNSDRFTRLSVNENAVIGVTIKEAAECTKNSTFYDFIEHVNQSKYTLRDGYDYFSMQSSMDILRVSYS